MNLPSPALVTLSVALAVVISLLARWLTFYFRRAPKSTGPSVLFPVEELGGIHQATPSSMSQPQLADPLAVQEQLVGDEVLRANVIQLFLEDCPRRLGDIRAAIERRDAESLRTAARMLKGAATNLSAGRLFHLAESLERIGAEARLDAAGAAWCLLAAEAAQTMEALRRIKQPHAAKSANRSGD